MEIARAWWVSASEFSQLCTVQDQIWRPLFTLCTNLKCPMGTYTMTGDEYHDVMLTDETLAVDQAQKAFINNTVQ